MLLLLVQSSNSAVPYAVDNRHEDETLWNQTAVLDVMAVKGGLTPEDPYGLYGWGIRGGIHLVEEDHVDR